MKILKANDGIRITRRICVYLRLTRWPASYAPGVISAAQEDSKETRRLQ